MPQSSLTAWLNQPTSVKHPPNRTRDENAAPSLQQQLPTPPREEQSKADSGGNDIAPTTSKIGSYRELPPNVELRPCTKEDIPHLKRLTSLLLPIPYPERFYKEIIDDEVVADLTLLAVWHDDPSRQGAEKGRLVGAIRCRLLNQNDAPPTPSGPPPMLYLSTLILLSPFRNHGIATHLLQRLIKHAVRDYGITSVGAHVWEANVEGLEWYRKRGFKEIRRDPGYYRRLDPQDAVVMQRDVRVGDLLNG